MKALYVETWYGGSHRYFADRWIANSRHDFRLLTMPPRFWKWRQAGASLHMAEKIPADASASFDAMVVSGMCDLGQLKALRPDLPPVMLYVHENQFVYPLSEGERPDFRYGMTDLSNALSADAPVFNSLWNRESLLDECGKLFKRLPDARPIWTIDEVRKKSSVVYPGIDSAFLNEPDSGESLSSKKNSRDKPLIVWNHRHEHDKDPETSFRVLEKLASEGVGFNLAILGERFKKAPPSFDRIRESLSDRILIDAYPPRDMYRSWLQRADVVISSAVHEFFGLSVMEGIAAGCWPVLPRRLSYPELIPDAFKDSCLWGDDEDYTGLLRSVLTPGTRERRNRLAELRSHAATFVWENQSKALDDILANLVHGD